MDPRAGLLCGDAVQDIGERIVLETGTQCQAVLAAQGGIRHDPADQRQEFPVLGGKIRGLLYHEYIAEQRIVHDDAAQQVVKGLILTAVYLRALLIGKAAAAPDIPDALQDRAWFAGFDLCPVHKSIFTHRRLPPSRPDQIQPVFRKPGKCGLVTGICIGKIKDILHRGFRLRARAGQLLHMEDLRVFRDIGIRHRIIL